MTDQTVTINVHHPQIERAQKIDHADTVSITLSNGSYHGSVTLIFSDDFEAAAFGMRVVDAIAGLEK